MKYIKYYNESYEYDFYKNIEEICYEITDDGIFNFSIQSSPSINIHPYVYITKKSLYINRSFKYDEVREVISRIIEFSSKNFDIIKVLKEGDSHHTKPYSSKFDENIEIDEPIYGVAIFFKF